MVFFRSISTFVDIRVHGTSFTGSAVVTAMGLLLAVPPTNH
jgi:hypothetical protein